jgi:carbonic anhydrase
MFDLIYRFDPSDPASPRIPKDAEEARQLLVQGNRDFAETRDLFRSGKGSSVISLDPLAFGWGVATGDAPIQAPYAAVLGCADARVPTEMVFSKGSNELFVVRLAGNVLGNECLGSLRYAVTHFRKTLKLLVVLAHAKCGAVTEAVDIYLDPDRYVALASDHNTRSLVDQILVAVRVASRSVEIIYGRDIASHPGYRAALIEAAVVLNAAWSAHCLSCEFRSLAPELGVVFGAYDLVSNTVRLPLSLPTELTEEEKGLFPRPENAEEFRELSRKICRGKLVERLLDPSAGAHTAPKFGGGT